MHFHFEAALNTQAATNHVTAFLEMLRQPRLRAIRRFHTASLSSAVLFGSTESSVGHPSISRDQCSTPPHQTIRPWRVRQLLQYLGIHSAGIPFAAGVTPIIAIPSGRTNSLGSSTPSRLVSPHTSLGGPWECDCLTEAKPAPKKSSVPIECR